MGQWARFRDIEHKRGKFLFLVIFHGKIPCHFFHRKIGSIKPGPFDPVNYMESIRRTFSIGQWARFRDIGHGKFLWKSIFSLNSTSFFREPGNFG